MIGRYVFAIVTGTLVTLSLLFLMQLLIAYGEEAITKPRAKHMLEFVRIKRNENVQTEDIKPEKPPPPPQAPPNVPPPSVSSETQIGGPGGMNIAEGDYLPIVRVAPVYPARALSRGIEGYVDMSFTVTTTGTVKDPVVMFSTSSLFERAATQAVLKFKYKPRVVDGQPVDVPNVKTRITFKIEE